jgi:hypothetical protein
MVWLYLVLALVVGAALAVWTVYLIVRWILTDAPPGTRFWGISNGPPEAGRRGGEVSERRTGGVSARLHGERMTSRTIRREKLPVTKDLLNNGHR